MKNAIFQYTEVEQMVREVTSNTEEEPREELMREVAKGTFTVELRGILGLIWRRLAIKNNPHHPYKCLVLLEYLLREGNTELILQQLRVGRRLEMIENLTTFAWSSEERYGAVMGAQSMSAKVRLRAERFLSFVENDEIDEGDDLVEDSKKVGAEAMAPTVTSC